MKASRTGPLVLYVDDEAGNRVVFEQTLARDFNVTAVGDAATAIAAMERQDVAVLVTDMRMPSMSGDELLRVVKERWPLTIRMVVTAYSDVDPILRAINDGLVVRYIVKPWDRVELVQILRWATEAWALAKDSAAVHRRVLETERLVTLGSLSAMLVHDLKQPLMSLTVNVEQIRELAADATLLAEGLARIGTAHAARVAELVQVLPQMTEDVKRSVEHLHELISGLRGFSRPASIMGPIATDPVPILRQAISSCRELVTRVHAQIELDGPAPSACVRMPATELTQVLINLIANGAQAVTARGAPDGRVAVSAREDGHGMLQIEIRDNGVGMAPDVLARVGTPFFTTRDEGTGLGLANCQRLVGAAGGRLRVESEVGVGTTVTVLLPIATT